MDLEQLDYFLTPKFCSGYNIELCNHYIISLTGYPLFLTFSMENNVDEIKYMDLKLNLKNYVNELYELSGKNRGLWKGLIFWKDNDEVSVPLFEEKFEYYMDVQPYGIINNIDFVKIISNKPFKLVHEYTGEILGNFIEFRLDKMFKLINTENGEFKLTEMQVPDIMDGKYDFVIN